MTPLAIIWSGLGRTTLATRPFGHVLAARGFDVLLRSLPRQGEPLDMGAPTMSELAQHVAEQSHGADLLIAESLVGLAALHMTGGAIEGLRLVIAVDPPLTMLKHVALHAAFRREDVADMFSPYRGICGTEEGEPEERDYRAILEGRPAIETHILAGGERHPRTVLWAEDRALIRAADGFALHEFPEANHMVLGSATEEAADLIARLYRDSRATD